MNDVIIKPHNPSPQKREHYSTCPLTIGVTYDDQVPIHKGFPVSFNFFPSHEGWGRIQLKLCVFPITIFPFLLSTNLILNGSF